MSREVTTVVVTRNRWVDLARSLAHHEQPVVVVDNGSSDGTPGRILSTFPDVRLVRLSRNEGAVARNHGVRAAETPYVAFADDDSWWEAGSLARAAELLDQHQHLGLIAGRVVVGDDRRLDPVCAAMAESPLPRSEELPGPAVLGFLACGAVVRRDAFLEAGGFDPVVHFPGEEERLALDLAAAGWELAYVDHVIAQHHPAASRGPSLRRRALEERNRLLTALMRRPWPVVREIAAEQARGDAAARWGLSRAAARAPWALARRRELPPEIEERRRLLDRSSQVR